jgi:hypothetical protein
MKTDYEVIREQSTAQTVQLSSVWHTSARKSKDLPPNLKTNA